MAWPFSHWTWRDLTRSVMAKCDERPPGRTIADVTARIEALNRHYHVVVEAADYRPYVDGEYGEVVEGYEAGDDDYYKGMRVVLDVNGSPHPLGASPESCESVPKWSWIYIVGNPNPDEACNDTPPSGELVVASVEKYFNANDAGGDDEAWDGILGNQGGSGDGADGTDYYYFKSTSPDEWQHSFAVAAGNIYRVRGWYQGTTGGGSLKFAFGTAAAGTDSHLFGPTVIGDPTVLYTTVNPDDPADWTPFLSDVTAPEGTVSAALGRDGSVTFDEVYIELLEEGEPRGIDPCA